LVQKEMFSRKYVWKKKEMPSQTQLENTEAMGVVEGFNGAEGKISSSETAIRCFFSSDDYLSRQAPSWAGSLPWE
jgi:hypothetical protein